MSKITWKQLQLIEELQEQLPLYSQLHDEIKDIKNLTKIESSKLIERLLEGVSEEDDYGWDAHK